jgi:hypothetical protein
VSPTLPYPPSFPTLFPHPPFPFYPCPVINPV